MTMTPRDWIAALLTATVAVGLASCADMDNPTALSDLNLTVNVEFPGHMHTLTPNEFHFQVSSGSDPTHMSRLEFDVLPPGGAPAQRIPIEEVDGELRAQVYLYAAGEHHLRLRGQAPGHHLMMDLWEHEIMAARAHIVVDGHRFELETSPAPILPGGLALLHVFAFELEADGRKGPEAHDLQLAGALHLPDGTMVTIAWAEQGHGEYVGQAVFPAAGSYSIQVGLAGGDEHDEADEGQEDDEHSEFHIRVPSGSDAPPPAEDNGDGHGH